MLFHKGNVCQISHKVYVCFHFSRPDLQVLCLLCLSLVACGAPQTSTGLLLNWEQNGRNITITGATEIYTAIFHSISSPGCSRSTFESRETVTMSAAILCPQSVSVTSCVVSMTSRVVLATSCMVKVTHTSRANYCVLFVGRPRTSMDAP